MNPYEMFATNKELEQQGIEIDYGDFSITIARAGGSNKKFAKVLTEKMQPHARSLKNETMDDGLADKLHAEAYAEAVILGWKGVKDRDGKAMEFTKVNVTKLLLDLPELFKDLQDQATGISMFRQRLVDDAKERLEKN